MENILLTITRIVRETSNSKTFYFVADKAFDYKAGQFITLLLEIDGKELRRSYSLGSTPGIDKETFITFKRIENGAVSRYLFDKLKEGDVLKALSPAGRFTLEENFSLYFFIAAGSGITPVYSLIKEILYRHENSNVILLYQNNNEADAIYRNSLLYLSKQYSDRFNLIEFFSRPFEDEHLPRRLNNYSLEQLLLKHVYTDDVIFYLCGPKDYMRMAEFTLKVIGFEERQIRKENFVVDIIPPAPFMSDTSDKEVKISLDKAQYVLHIAYPHNILEVALKHNILLPYSCRGGRCSACAATCTKGKVKMSINEVLTEKDLEKGLVLTCVGYPESDVELVFE